MIFDFVTPAVDGASASLGDEPSVQRPGRIERPLPPPALDAPV
jgi:hypothetical protein